MVAFQVLKVGPRASKAECRRSSSNSRKEKSARNLMKSMAIQMACSRSPPKEGKYQEVKSNCPEHEGNHQKEGGR
jgi:hypothetical protein